MQRQTIKKHKKMDKIVRIELKKEQINPLFSDTKEVAYIIIERNGKLFQEKCDLTNEMDYVYYRNCKRKFNVQNNIDIFNS